MSEKKTGPTSGMSLIEFMIALGIMSVIAYGAMHFFSRLTQSDAEVSAKAKAQTELAHLASLLEKDLKFRDIKNLTELCTANICTQITIDRLGPGGIGTYTVSYTSSCKALPSNSKLSGLIFTGTNSECIKALNCPSGTYPSLAIDVPTPPTGGAAPTYPPLTPPLGQKRSAYNLVGAALCATRTKTTNVATPTPHTVSQDRILLEGAFLGSNNVIRVERKETVFSSNNMAKIQMLPN
jgi:prepilin-type N-terminal cleavage/methylation domain-containing protein